MQDPEREREVEGVIFERDVADACEMKAEVCGPSEVLPGHVKCIFAGVEQMKMADFRRHHYRPAPAAATNVDADRIGRQLVPWKDSEVGLEDGLAVDSREFAFALSEGRPFVAESGRDVRINVSREVIHHSHFARPVHRLNPCLLDVEGFGQAAQHCAATSAVMTSQAILPWREARNHQFRYTK